VSVTKIPPPRPAPYLAGIPPLSPESLRAARKKRLTKAELARVRREQTDRQRKIIAARLAWQQAHGVEILPEPVSTID
jgi:hypothetical protein